MSLPLLRNTSAGLYCEQGDFYIDPTRKVSTALVTHGHADHAYAGMGLYITHRLNEPVLRTRLGKNISVVPVEYSERRVINGVKVSFHPASHVLGSAQIRLEYRGEVWVVSGDYKRETDPFATPFEVVPCTTFITESTFALPMFAWKHPSTVAADIETWWKLNREQGINSVIVCYSLGKAQRLLGMIDTTQGAVFVHPAAFTLNNIFREQGIPIPTTHVFTEDFFMNTVHHHGKALILAPASALTPSVQQLLHPSSIVHTSGWIAARTGAYRKEEGFVLSDHADWPGLLQTVSETSAQRIYVTHGYTKELTRWLQEHDIDAHELSSLT